MTPRALVLAYLDAFGAGDVGALAETLGEPFLLEGPLATFTSRAAYLDSLRDGGPPGPCTVLEEVYASDRAAVLYAIAKPDGALRVAQFFRLRGGRIVASRLVFDAAPGTRASPRRTGR